MVVEEASRGGGGGGGASTQSRWTSEASVLAHLEPPGANYTSESSM